MKIFVYKTLFVCACVFILFQLLIGVKIKQLNYEVEKFKSKENIEAVKNKLREEMQSAIDKVAAENSYDYILDFSQGFILYKLDSHDLTQLVIDKMNKMSVDQTD